MSPPPPTSLALAALALPEIDDRLIQPETPYEVLDGVVMYVSPADDPHAERQAQLVALLSAHVGLDYQVACELLTRTSFIDDFAPDASVYPAARHPVTGRRQLEELAFEVVSRQAMSVSARKAAKLVARGVRRVFAINVERSLAFEWSRAQRRWRKLEGDVIEDPTLDVPLPVAALIHAVVTDNEVARALLAKRNSVLLARENLQRAQGRKQGRKQGQKQGREQGRTEGRIEGNREALLALLGARGIAVGKAARARIAAETDPAQLVRWIVRAARCRSTAALFGKSK